MSLARFSFTAFSRGRLPLWSARACSRFCFGHENSVIRSKSESKLSHSKNPEVIFKRRSRRGVVLLTALWIVALLSILVLGLVYRVRLKMSLTEYQKDNLEARTLLESGWARTLASLRQDTDMDVDHGGEKWCSSPSMTEEGLIPVEYKDQATPAVRWRVVDESSKLNVNTIAVEALEKSLAACYELDTDTKSLSTYIRDWIDHDNEGEGEEDYYSTLKPPMSPRNDVVKSVEELMAVRGVTPWLFYGEDANGNGILDDNEDDGARRPPDDNADGKMQPGLRDLFTIWGDGTINVNTAPVKTLEALFGVFLDPVKASDLAVALDKKRSGPDGVQGTADDTPLRTAAEIAQIVGGDNYQKCKGLGAKLGVNSAAFSVEVHVRLESANVEMNGRGLVLREEGKLKVAYWRIEE